LRYRSVIVALTSQHRESARVSRQREASSVLTGWALGWLSHVPGTRQASADVAGMLVLGLSIPLVGSLCAVPLLRCFDSGHKRHACVLATLLRKSTRDQSGAVQS
jgi:GPH family glycoside/pentoside/hexuronide:cation symporter